MSKRLGVGVIGANHWAEEAHLSGYKAYDRANLVAICDIQRCRAQAMADQFGIAEVYTDHREMLADPAVEMVNVCTSTHTHLSL